MRILSILLASSMFVVSPGLRAQQASDEGTAAQIQNEEFESRYREAENYRQAIGVDLDIQRSLTMHRELADAGFGRSLHRLGDFYYYGIGVAQDYRQAADYYGAAAEAGHTTSLVRQSRTLRRVGAGSEALDVIEHAITLNLDGALEERSAGHLFAEYGDRSDVGFGLAETRRLADDPANQISNYQLAEAYRRGVGVDVDHAAAFQIYSALREQGHAAATERLADYYAEGVATERDPETALELYRTAASLGREGAYVPLAKLLAEIGRGEDALLAMQQGVDAGDGRAEREMAVGHLDGIFGTASDREFGRTELNRLAEGGDLRAAAMVLDRIGDGEDLNPDLDRVLGQLDSAMQNGDGRAAETLLRFYREVPNAVDDTRGRRQAILDTYAPLIRGRVYYPELANLAYDTNNGTDAYPMLLEILREADGVGYERALLQIFWRDKNAFTYVLQSELKERDLYAGNINGYMTRNTVRGALNYCEENNIYDVCIHGPLRTPAVRLISAALRHDREVAAGQIDDQG